MISNILRYNNGRGNRHYNARNDSYERNTSPLPTQSKTFTHVAINKDLNFESENHQPLEFGLANRRVIPITSLGIRGRNVPQR